MYIDRKNGGRKYDRVIADEIWDKMDKNRDNLVTINEFINIYVLAEEILHEKIRRTKKEYN
jgi:hypothetical protein